MHWLVVMFFGAYGETTNALTGTVAASLQPHMILSIAGGGGGRPAHALGTPSGTSPRPAGPGAVVAVTALAIIAIFVRGSVMSCVIDPVRRSPPPRPAPAVDRRY